MSRLATKEDKDEDEKEQNRPLPSIQPCLPHFERVVTLGSLIDPQVAVNRLIGTIG